MSKQHVQRPYFIHASHRVQHRDPRVTRTSTFCLCKKKIFFVLQRSVNKTLISHLSRDFTEKLFSPFCQPLVNNATPTRLKEVQLSVLSVLIHHQALEPPDSISAMGQNCITISFEMFMFKISKELKVEKILQTANKQEVYY